MKLRFAVVALLLVMCWPAPAAAQVELKIAEGRVWLMATNATVGQILDEWTRVGGTEIVNGDRVPGGPITLELSDVSEQEALDVLLRTAAGFMAVRKAAPATASSTLGRILILPTTTVSPAALASSSSSAPEPVVQDVPVFPQPETAPVFAPGVQAVIGPDGQPLADDQEGAPPQTDQPVRLPPGFSPIDPNTPPPPVEPEAPVDVTNPPAPTAPVGVPVPGMIVPAPQAPGAQNPTQPGAPNPNQR